MKKRFILIIVSILILSTVVGCSKENQYKKFDYTFFGTFDTMTQVIGYAKSEKEFTSYMEQLESRFQELHKYYDKYNDYEGINNIKTINDNAGVQPIKVEKEIIDLIKFSKEWYEKVGVETNIALGPVLNIWHNYREDAKSDPINAKIPPMEDLIGANRYTDLNKVILDEENSTVYLEEKQMKLDVGSVAKGYAVELVAQEMEKAGLVSAIISGGGNVRTIGKPLDGIRDKWGIALQNPDKAVLVPDDNMLDVVFVNDLSVVSSGDYQRYYEVDGKKMHHIIDPKTLMPGDYYRAVTIVTKDSGLADFLSTSVFLLPYEESRQLVESLEGVEAMWVMEDGEIEVTEGMKKILRSYGATEKSQD